MSSTELSDLEALLEQVLVDPRGYAERVVAQLLDRLAAATPAEPAVGGAAGDQVLADRNLVLAAALGACECWGDEPACPACLGQGQPGWTRPDPELYEAYIRPARGPRPPTTVRATAPTAADDLIEVAEQNGASA